MVSVSLKVMLKLRANILLECSNQSGRGIVRFKKKKVRNKEDNVQFSNFVEFIAGPEMPVVN